MTLARWTVVSAALLLLASRLCHLDLLWIEEAYPMAAAAELLRGKVLYRDIWFDKPPFYALSYAAWGAAPGWPLRLAGTLYLSLTCLAGWLLLRESRAQEQVAAGAALTAFYLTFDIPSSVMALAPDLLTVPLHLIGVAFAMRGRALLAGLSVGTALLFNTKSVFILLACSVFAPRITLLIGFLLPNAAAFGWMAYTGALTSYFEQVWVWGLRYSSDTFVANPLREGIVRTANWLGFHLPLSIGAVVFFAKRFSWRAAVWLGCSFVAVAAGLRFFPRYYFHLLPVFLFAGVRGLWLLSPKWRTGVLALLLIPALRFGPRYVSLASGNRNWSDLALMEDSREAARIARSSARPGDRLLVWGYRPDVFVFSQLPAATRFLDSQPLTGVLADRHLTDSTPTAAEAAARNRRELAASRPEIIVDGLGPLNPSLAANRYPELHLDAYEIAGRTRMSIVYVTKR